MILITSYAADLITRYFATVEDVATINYFFKAYLIGALASLTNQL